MIENSVASSDVGLQILRSLIGNLDRALQNRLGNDVHFRQGWWFRGNEASEVLVAGLGDFFQVAFESVQANKPGLHEMDVLEHNPVSGGGRFEESFLGSFFLTLSHGNIDESSVGDRDVELGAAFLDVRSWVHTREQHEENGSVGSGFVVSLHHVERRLFNVLGSHLVFNEHVEGR